MTSGPAFRLARAAVFAAVCVAAAGLGHALMLRTVPGWAVGYAFAATTAGAWWVAGRGERGASAVTGATVVAQFALHGWFSLAQAFAAAPIGTGEMAVGHQAMDAMPMTSAAMGAGPPAWPWPTSSPQCCAGYGFGAARLRLSNSPAPWPCSSLLPCTGPGASTSPSVHPRPPHAPRPSTSPRACPIRQPCGTASRGGAHRSRRSASDRPSRSVAVTGAVRRARTHRLPGALRVLRLRQPCHAVPPLWRTESLTSRAPAPLRAGCRLGMHACLQHRNKHRETTAVRP